jgi:hypothetical protein
MKKGIELPLAIVLVLILQFASPGLERSPPARLPRRPTRLSPPWTMNFSKLASNQSS